MRSASKLADQVVVGIGVHPGKKPLFAFEERKSLIEEVAVGMDCPVRVESFDGLVVDAAKASGATMLIRGVRDGTDLDYEMQMSGMNGTLAPGIQTVFLPASPQSRHITATLVRQIAELGGDVSAFVPVCTLNALKAKFDD